jgi:ABC-type lipoprotein export system ATPase subunit
MIAIVTHEPDVAAQTKRTLQVKNGLVIDDAKASADTWSDRAQPEML